MHISLDSALGRQRRLNSVGESVFQIAPDAAAGYSLRSLTGGDPSVVRVRRESDNLEKDFNSSGVSSGELVNWVGSGNDGFVETWYDQSGNGKDATQLTASNQPKIVDSGTLVTATNGLPAMRVLGNTQSLGIVPLENFSDFSAFYVVKHQAIGSSISWLGDSSGGDYLRYSTSAYQLRAQGSSTSFINFDTTISTGDDYLLSAVRASNTLKFFIDGSAQANTVSSSGIFDVQKLFQRGGNTSQTLNGFAQELILYPSDQSANRSAIEANINNQYDIY